jgi:D-glycero-D-manno-heptose 1,7-bisphosphate phosphatase
MERNKAVFLDRDGVINHDPGDYTRSLDEFHVLPTVYDALKQLQDAGFLLVLITNQGGIAKGLYAHEHVAEIHRFFTEACAEHGIQLTGIYYSPHHPDFGESLSRKPGGLMIEKACARYQIDAAQSWMIGDKARDVEAGHKAGVEGIQIPVNGDLIDVVPQILAGHV